MADAATRGHNSGLVSNMPKVPESIFRAAEADRRYVFNAGPWQQEQLLGSHGTAIIRACPPGAEYGPPYVIEGIVPEYYPGDNGMKLLLDDAESIANAILSVGPHTDQRNCLIPWGVFVSPTNPPAPEDVLEARKQIYGTLQKLVRQASDAYAKGPKEFEETVGNSGKHYEAARFLMKTEAECPWLKNTATPKERDECPGCGSIYTVGVMKCRECGFVLDKAKHDAAVEAGLFGDVPPSGKRRG